MTALAKPCKRCKWAPEGQPYTHPIKGSLTGARRWYHPQRCVKCGCTRLKTGDYVLSECKDK